MIVPDAAPSYVAVWLARLGAPAEVIKRAVAVLCPALWDQTVIVASDGTVRPLDAWDGRDGWCLDLSAVRAEMAGAV